MDSPLPALMARTPLRKNHQQGWGGPYFHRVYIIDFMKQNVSTYPNNFIELMHHNNRYVQLYLPGLRALKLEISRYPKTIYTLCLNHMKRAATQTQKDYGLEALTKIPSLYEVPKLRNLNFCCCTVCFQGGVGCERNIGLRSSRKPQVSIKSQS